MTPFSLVNNSLVNLIYVLLVVGRKMNRACFAVKRCAIT